MIKLVTISLCLISSALSIELLLSSDSAPQLFKSPVYNDRPLKSGLYNENCESATGILLDISIENCTNLETCNIVTKREYNVQIDFIPRTASSNLYWRITTDDEVLIEKRVVGDISPGLTYTVSYSFAFDSSAEGKILPVAFQILDKPSELIEICATSTMDVSAWHMVPEILTRIRPPTFRDEDFVVTNYGAVADGVTDNTEAFKTAIEACNAAGGGRVVVSAGTFLTGAITILSNVNLHLMEGSTILFTHDISKYPIVRSRTEGMEYINYSPFIYAYEAENIGLTGSGTLDGNADCENWWPWNGRNSNLEAFCNITEPHPGQAVSLALLTDMVARNVPVEERVFGDGHYLRPQFVQPQRSKNVLIEGVTLKRSPMWILNPVLCENVIIRGVTIDSKGPNSDGCDPESSKDVLIENVKFHTGDDCIAIKSGRNNDGRRVNVRSENIIIQNCEFQDGHGAFTIGSEISGGAKNIFCQDSSMSSPNLEQALRFKNNALRGGLIEDVFIRNIHISELYNGASTTRGMVLSIDFYYQEGLAGDYSPVVRNVDIRNVTATTANYAFYLRGFPSSHITDIRLYDCNFDNVVRNNVIEFVDHFHLDNVTVNGEIFTRTEEPDCESAGTLRGLKIENCTENTPCSIVPKREYNVEATFVPTVFSASLIWKVTATINGEEETISEQALGRIILPGLEQSISFPLRFDTKHEGLSFPISFQILDPSSQRVEICGSADLDISTWHMVPEILSRISPPTFPNQDFSILDYGAVEGGEILNTEAFKQAIEACNAAGGGRVVVPPGVYLSSAIQLLSNVNLHLTEGSRILFTQDTSTYPIVHSRWEGMELMNYSPFIYAFETENIALTGTGTLDGNSDCEHWWPWKGRNNNLELLCGVIEGFPIQDDDRNVLLDMVERGVPVEERVFGENHYLRPQFVQPHRSKNVLIEDITLVRSPMWILNPVQCENVIVRGVTINSTGPNSDGCDPESCKDVLIENVKFRTGDDCIAVKSGRNADGHRLGIKSENIVVQNCEFEDGHGGFTIGSEISGGAQNIFCQDCVMSSPHLEQALRFKNNAVRGALIEDIFIRNIKISELYTGTSPTRGMALSIDFYYEEGPAGNHTPIVRNVDIRNVTASKANYALYLRGFPKDHIEDIRLYDCHFDEVQRPNVIEFVDRLQFFNVTLNGEPLITPQPGCESAGTLLGITIENCTDTTACKLITKREYNVGITFLPSAASSNLIWRVTATINDEEETILELPLESSVLPDIEHTVSFPLRFETKHEGLSFPISYKIIEPSTERVEICGSADLDISTWHMVPEILSRISPPIFPNRDFSILDYGAVEGGEILNTEAFKQAIEACNAAGGGRVVVPPGVYLSSAIQLLSNVNLHLTEGSRILFTQDTSTYPIVHSRWEGMELMNYSPFIYAFETENIALTGTGTLDGNSDCEHWWPWKGRNNNLELLCGIIEGFPIQDDDRNVLLDMVERGVPVEERVFGENHYLRPQFVQPHRSKNVLIEDITLVRSPMWILNPVQCENVIVRGVTINSTGPNSDGCDPESCKDVLIENVKFRTGDDCIAVKSGRNADGHRLGIKSENIVVQNCEFEDGHGGFTIGSEISGGAQNIFCQDCVMSSPHLEQALRFKNNAVRGALIEDIFIRNIKISELYTGTSATRGMALSIDFYYEEGPAGNHTPIVRNVDIRNVTASKSNYALYLRGFPEEHIEDIRLYDCHFDEVQRPNVIDFVDRLQFFNVTLNGEPLITPQPDCEFTGSLRGITFENCTDTTACKFITKREYNVGVNFVPSAASSNLIWRVTATINDEEETILELPLGSNVSPGVAHAVSFPLRFDTKHEGLSFPISYQIIDPSTQRVEICGSAHLDISTWHMVPEILSRISPPTFPNRDFSILDYGAVEGGEILNTEAFKQAIEACNAAGGGRVVVPPGVYLSSAIQLLSNVNLHLTEGSTILFTQDTSTYPIVHSRWEGMELMNYSPFIYAFETENIALTGTGTLDGNSDCEHWWPWKGRNNNLEILCGVIEGFPIQDDDRNVLLDMVERGVPVEERVFGENHYLRPQFVQPHRSKNVLIEDITLVRSPMWILNPVQCENVIVRGVTINSTGPNSDGCDPESCKDVLIENVKFRTGDDCIAVKSGRNADGHRLGVKSENIVVQNCEFEDGHGGFTIGSEISGGAQNIFCQDCVMSSPQLEQALRFKNNAVRGALIEDIFIRNIKISELYTGTSATRGMALSIDFYYEEGPAGNHTPIVRNVDIRNVTASKSNYALYLRGFPEDHIEDIRLYDCHFDDVQRPNVIEFVDRLQFFNVTLNGEPLLTPVPQPTEEPTDEPTEQTTNSPSEEPTSEPTQPTQETTQPTQTTPSSSSLLKIHSLAVVIIFVVVIFG